METQEVLSEDQLREIAEKAIFNGFIQIEDLVYMMAEGNDYSEILPLLWKFYECRKRICGTVEIKTQTCGERVRSWTQILERMGGIFGHEIWEPDENIKAWYRKNLTPIRHLEICRYSETGEQPVNNNFDRIESDYVKLENLKEYFSHLEQVLKIRFPLPRRLFPETSKEDVLTSDNIFCKEGQFWSVSYQGKTIMLKDVRGLQYIKWLLQHPNRGFKTIELLRLFDKPLLDHISENYAKMTDEELRKQNLRRTSTPEDGMDILDPVAKAQYRQNLTEIEEEMKEAEEIGNQKKLNKLREKKDFIMDELKSAVGLRGRRRQTGDPTEKSRKAVTNRIKESLKTIKNEHPLLGEHLSKYIKTGMECIYNPPENISWIT